MVDVLDAEVDAAGADGLGQAVVRVILMVREPLHPAFDEAVRDRLRADVHEPPLVEDVVRKVDVAAIDGVEDVLRPGHQEPDDGAALGGDSAEDPLGADAL